MPTALIAEDEPLLRAQLKARLAEAWPELDIVAEAANGREALELAAAARPDVAFLDIRMPEKTGLDVARELAGACHIVFVTAYDEYAVAAFDEGAVDYVLKPPTAERIAKVRDRVRARLAAPPLDLAGVLAKLAAHRGRRHAPVDPRVARRVDEADRRRRGAVLPGRGQVHEGRSPPTARR